MFFLAAENAKPFYLVYFSVLQMSLNILILSIIVLLFSHVNFMLVRFRGYNF